MEEMSTVYTTSNKAFCTYLVCTSMLCIKMMWTTLLTVMKRTKTKTLGIIIITSYIGTLYPYVFDNSQGEQQDTISKTIYLYTRLFSLGTMADETSSSVVINIFSVSNQVFCSYLICTSLLILKMMATICLTILQRMRKKAYISQEDSVFFKAGEDGTKPNETVERVRRAYQNDIENILLFMIISLGYLAVNPPLWLYNTFCLVYLITRTLHTVVYAVYVVRQPSRAILWATGFIILGYMAAHTAIYAFVKGYCGSSKGMNSTHI